MEATLKFVIDPRAPGAADLMKELEAELRALDVGEVTTEKQRAPEGTLAVDLVTVVLVLKITYWSIKIGKAVFDIIKEVREKQAAALNQAPETLGAIFVVPPTTDTKPLALPASQKKEQELLETIDKGR
jgi:hypothetical protein